MVNSVLFVKFLVPFADDSDCVRVEKAEVQRVCSDRDSNTG
jgi:hypothetical protein